MQIQTPPPRGRPAGSRGKATIKKAALKTLEAIMQDENSPAEARVMAACKLIDQVQQS